MTDGTAKWLRFWTLLMGVIGVGMAAAAWPALDGPMRLLLDIAYWPIDGHPNALGPDGRLGAVMDGALLAGWSVLLAGLFAHIHKSGDGSLLRPTLISLSVWFVLDSLGSIAVGAWMNAILNVGILAGFVVPILRDGTPSAQPHAA